MNNTNTGGPAFPALPITRKSNGELLYQSAGLTMRDYFAAKAMQTLLIAQPKDWPMGFDVSVSVAAYQMADAMLKARGE